MKVYFVATPLGNPEDITIRAQKVLASADLIFCEDTRKTRALLTAIKSDFKGKLVPLPGDSEMNVSWEKHLDQKFKTIAFVSDAGTPLVNDPGRALLEFCKKNNVEWDALPGACAPILAWQLSGGFGLGFYFAGFAPKAKSAQSKDIKEFFSLLNHVKTFVFFDSKHQLETTLEYLFELNPEKEICICRELTKEHQEILFFKSSEALIWFRERKNKSDQFGEMTLIVKGEGLSPRENLNLTLENILKLRTLSPKECSKYVNTLVGIPTKETYDYLFKNKSE